MGNKLFLMPTAISLFFMVMFLVKKKNNSKPILALYFLLFLIILFSLILLLTDSLKNSIIVNIFSLLFYVATLSIPPTLYVYVCSLSNIKKLTNKIILLDYVLPIILLIINTFCFIYLSFNESNSYIYKVSEDVMNYSNFIALLFIFPLLNIFYLYKIIIVYKEHTENLKHAFSYENGVGIKWIRHFLLGYILFIGVIILLLSINSVSISTSVFLNLFLSMYLLFVGIKGHKQSKIIFNIGVRNSIKNNGTDLLEPNKKIELKNSIIKLMKHNKPHLNSKLTLDKFSKNLSSNSKYISNVLNTEFNQNFATFINLHRIDEAKKLLKKEVNEQYTIEAIAKMSGFNSKSAFNNAFKQFEKMTPTEFKNNSFDKNNSLVNKHNAFIQF